MSKKRKINRKSSGNGSISAQGILPSVLLSVVAMLASFALVVFAAGCVLYFGGFPATSAWIGYLIAAIVAAAVSAGYGCRRLPIPRMMSALIWAFVSVAIHSVVLSALNPDATGNRKLIILLGVIAACVLFGLTGAKRK